MNPLKSPALVDLAGKNKDEALLACGKLKAQVHSVYVINLGRRPEMITHNSFLFLACYSYKRHPDHANH